MTYDLVIRGGTVIDGTGLPGYRADVGVVGDKIAAIGKIADRGVDEVDAAGLVVTPGFVDGHTHMDAQAFWDPLGRSSCWHGVTSAVFGNCGFTLAPVRPDTKQLALANIERAEDISGEAIAQGIDWTWESFPEFMDALDKVPKGINYAANIGHSSLRTWAMGERAFEEPATVEDLEAMAGEIRAALAAGAFGFTTSRSGEHKTTDDRPVASRIATWDEVRYLVSTLGEYENAVFEISHEAAARDADPAVRADYHSRMRQLALDSGVPFTFGVVPTFADGSDWREQLAMIDATCAAGGRMYGMSNCRGVTGLLSFQTHTPFDNLPLWRELRRRPLDEQLRALDDLECRAALVQAAHDGPYLKATGAETRPPDYGAIRVLLSMTGSNPTVQEMANLRRVDPVELMIDLAVSSNFDQYFVQPFSHPDDNANLAVMRHPRTVMTFSDSGAHVSQIIDSSIHTFFLAHWVREREAFTLEEAIRMITLAPASVWGISDRALVREGLVADLNVFDPNSIAPCLPSVKHDLPGGGTRLSQHSIGIHATVVGGETVISEGEHTGNLPGKLLRRRT